MLRLGKGGKEFEKYKVLIIIYLFKKKKDISLRLLFTMDFTLNQYITAFRNVQVFNVQQINNATEHKCMKLALGFFESLYYLFLCFGALLFITKFHK